MMGVLKLRLNMFGDEALGSTQVIANIYPSDRSAPTDLRRRLRDVPIPAGDEYGDWAQVEVPIGQYEVQVCLPSGETLMHDVEVTADDQDVALALESPSPHEWLSVQHFQGNVGARKSSDTDRRWVQQTVSRGASHWTPDYETQVTTRAAPPAPLKVTWCPDPNPPDAAVNIWDSVYDIVRERLPAAEAETRFIDALQAAGLAQPVSPYQTDDVVCTYRFTHGGIIMPGQARPDSLAAWDHVTPQRRYAIARDDSEARLVVAPVPWFDLRNPDRETAFEILSPLGSAAVTSAVHDTLLSAIVGYLTQGSIQNARLVLQPARDMLYEKVANPLGAAAGAYTMVLCHLDRSDTAWHHWVVNLRDHFAWLPDGAIALAKLRLNFQTSDADVEEALDNALEAYRRGLPFYSMGLRCLLDVLTAFHDDEDFAHRHDEIRHCLTRVRAIARRTNFQQTFTSLLLSYGAR